MITIALCALLQGVSFEDKRLGTIGDDVSADMICFSPDGKQVAYRGLKAGKYAVWINKAKGADYTMVDCLVFNRDNKASYRAAMGQSWQIVIGGSPVGTPMPFVGVPIFSPDGKKVAYEASRGQGVKTDKTAWHVITAGSKGADFQTALPPSWSGDGSITGYKVRIGKDGTAQRAFHTVNACVVGTTVGPECEETSNVFFAPKGKRWLYKMRSQDQWTMMVDGKAEGGNWATISDPVWSPDGTKYLVIAANDLEKGAVIVNGKKEGEHPGVQRPFWSPDSKDYGFVFRSPEGARVRLGEKVSDPFPDVGQPTVSLQGDATAFPARAKKGWSMVFGGRVGADDLNTIQPAVWSPDGKHVAYRAQWQFKWIVCVDDGRAEKFDQAGDPVWSPDSTKIAHAGQKDGKWYMIVGYRKGEAFDEVLTAPHWSADGTKVAFGARKGPDLLWRVVPVQ
jgi:Tol biopolymer transport system component